ECDTDRQSTPSSHTIHESSEDSLSDGISNTKCDYEVCVVCVRPVIFQLQKWSEERECLPVNVIDHRRSKQQSADPPPQRPYRTRVGTHNYLDFLMIAEVHFERVEFWLVNIRSVRQEVLNGPYFALLLDDLRPIQNMSIWSRKQFDVRKCFRDTAREHVSIAFGRHRNLFRVELCARKADRDFGVFNHL